MNTIETNQNESNILNLLKEILEENKGEGEILFPEIVSSPEGENQCEKGNYYTNKYVDQCGNDDYGYHGDIYYEIQENV